MIRSWKEFFIAVEKMRECQKHYFTTRSFLALLAAKKSEEAVDKCIKEKRSVWAKELQPEFF